MGRFVVDQGEEEEPVEFPTVSQFLSSPCGESLTDLQRHTVGLLSALSSFAGLDWDVECAGMRTTENGFREIESVVFHTRGSERSTSLAIDERGDISITHNAPAPTPQTLDIAALILRVQLTGFSH